MPRSRVGKKEGLLSQILRHLGTAWFNLSSAAVVLTLAAGAASAQTPTPTPMPTVPDCTDFEYDQKPTNLGWAMVVKYADEEPGATGMTLEEGIVNGAGTLVGLTGSFITRVKVWGWTFDFSNLATGTVDPAVVFCGADITNRTQWNITFRAASADPQIPGDLLATRTVSFSSLLFSTVGINFNVDGGPPGPSAPCNAPATGCTQTGEWTFDFPPVPSQDVRWIGVQQQQGVNAPDGHPCVVTLLTEADTATYDDEVYQRGGQLQNVNEDLQICVGTSELAMLDIDGDGAAEALTDGLLGLRSLFGFTGATLTTGAVDTQNCTRCSQNAIGSYTEELATLDIIDIDGNGTPAALTDGLLFLRYLFGFRGNTLIAGAVAGGAPRDTAEEIEAYIAGLI